MINSDSLQYALLVVLTRSCDETCQNYDCSRLQCSLHSGTYGSHMEGPGLGLGALIEMPLQQELIQLTARSVLKPADLLSGINSV